MHRKPQIKPVAVASSISGYKERIEKEVEDESIEDDEPIRKGSKRKREKEPPIWWREEMTKSAERYERQYELQNKLVSSFADFINLKKKVRR